MSATEQPERDEPGREETATPGPGTSEEDLEALRAFEEALAEEGGLAEAASPAEPGASLEQVAAQRDEYLDALRRLQAEFDNYRKRVARQQSELGERATQGLLERLLPVLDALDLAVTHAKGGDDPDEDAAMMAKIAALLGDVLAKDGLERIGVAGEHFDPTVHDAVLHVPNESDEDAGEANVAVVEDVLRPGYRIKGRVIRPAMVKVRG